MIEEKIPCPNCPGEMVFQTFTNCFQQSVEFYKCVGCGFTLDKDSVKKRRRSKLVTS